MAAVELPARYEWRLEFGTLCRALHQLRELHQCVHRRGLMKSDTTQISLALLSLFIRNGRGFISFCRRGQNVQSAL